MTKQNDSLAEWVFHEMSSCLLGYLKTFLKNEVLAEDVLQNIFGKLLQMKTSTNEIKNLKAYVFTIARNEALKELQKSKKSLFSIFKNEEQNKSIFEIAQPEKVNKLEAMCLEEALLSLPEDQREIIYLKIYSNMTFDEIAETIKISINTVTSRYRYGINKIRTFLKEKP